MSRNLEKREFSAFNLVVIGMKPPQQARGLSTVGQEAIHEVFFSRQTWQSQAYPSEAPTFPLTLNTNSAMTVEHNKFDAFECLHL